MSSEVFDAVDALLARPVDLPPPAIRARLRQADGLTQAEVAEVLGVSRLSLQRWENGATTPRRRHRAAYERLLRGWTAKHPHVAVEDAAESKGSCPEQL